jgi:hypothetical protein
MENQDMEVQTMENQEMENNSFNEMSPNFPDLQGENRGRTPHAGWFQTEFMPWIQSLDLKKKLCNGIALFLVAGKMSRILRI